MVHAKVAGMTLNDCQEYGTEIGLAYFIKRKWNIKADYIANRHVIVEMEPNIF